MLKHVSLATFAALVISARSILAADEPATAAAPAAAPLGRADANGFISLFNGKDLTGWEGLAGFCLLKTASSTAAKPRIIRSRLISF